MAFDVSYQIEAIDKFSATAKRIEKSVGRLDKRVDSFSKRSSKRFSKVAVAAGVSAGKAIIQIGSRFQDQLADLSAITGATGKDLDTLKKKSFEMGKEFAVSGSNVLEAFKLVGSAKAELLKNIPALTEVTKQVLLLKNASGIDLASAAEITAQSLNIFGAGADQAGRFVNVLAAGAKEGASEIADTGAAMMIAGPLASKLGLSFESVNALLQGIAQGGIKGARAGTGLQGVLQRLAKEGVDFKKIGLSDLFVKVGEVIEGTGNAADKATLLQRLFGLEHQKTGLTLTSQAKHLDKLKTAITGTGVAQEQANIRLNTFNSRMRSLGTAIEEKIVPIFEKLAPKIEALAGDFAKWLDSLSNADISNFAHDIGLVAEAIVLIAKTGAFGAKLFLGTGKLIGEGIAEIQTKDYTKTAEQQGKVTVEMLLRGSTGQVESVKAKTAGPVEFDMGQNMATVAP